MGTFKKNDQDWARQAFCSLYRSRDFGNFVDPVIDSALSSCQRYLHRLCFWTLRKLGKQQTLKFDVSRRGIVESRSQRWAARMGDRIDEHETKIKHLISEISLEIAKFSLQEDCPWSIVKKSRDRGTIIGYPAVLFHGGIFLQARASRLEFSERSERMVSRKSVQRDTGKISTLDEFPGFFQSSLFCPPARLKEAKKNKKHEKHRRLVGTPNGPPRRAYVSRASLF